MDNDEEMKNSLNNIVKAINAKLFSSESDTFNHPAICSLEQAPGGKVKLVIGDTEGDFTSAESTVKSAMISSYLIGAGQAKHGKSLRKMPEIDYGLDGGSPTHGGYAPGYATNVTVTFDNLQNLILCANAAAENVGADKVLLPHTDKVPANQR